MYRKKADAVFESLRTSPAAAEDISFEKNPEGRTIKRGSFEIEVSLIPFYEIKQEMFIIDCTFRLLMKMARSIPFGLALNSALLEN